MFLDGADVSPPWEYISMFYRKKFGISLEEFNRMSYKTVMMDLEMMNVEGQINANRKHRKSNSKTNR